MIHTSRTAIDSGMASPLSYGQATPATTIDERETFGSLTVTREADPCAGDRFIVIDTDRQRALACYDGRLRLVYMHVDTKGHIPRQWQWSCVEKDGFMGLQNVAGKGFLGHDMWWNFAAKVPHHQGWEYFTMEKCDGGYYWIRAFHWGTPWPLVAQADGSGIVAKRHEGTPWEFVKVHSVD